ncbi:MAG: RNA-binding S4 domain-containing protein [Hyphomicrobiales bacterium]|jgi:ribosome-associated heat shock protein Hsp15|nr:RNA-binding S4 domain-containing protein [Hyphomicrobiales bacterium]
MRDDRQRLDKWIWFARFARTRTAARDLIEAGHVRIAGRRVTSAAHALKCGDVLTIAVPHATAVVRVIGLGTRRGGAASVTDLYEPFDPD